MEDYMKECLGEILEEYQITIDEKTLDRLAYDINSMYEMDAEMRSYRTGWTLGDKDPKDEKIKSLERQLLEEKNKVTCRECNGNGYTVSYGGTLQSEHRCYKCNGDGRL